MENDQTKTPPKVPEPLSHIRGWGIDADPDNDPTYPMRNRTTDAHQGYGDWNRPRQQTVDIEVNHSVERPGVSAVFGTAVEPSGVSGMIRRHAYQSSENEYSRWLPLLLADRVNMVEGVVQDLAHGRLPNFFAEKGLTADWKYDRPRLIAKLALGAAVVLATAACLSRHTEMGRKASGRHRHGHGRGLALMALTGGTRVWRIVALTRTAARVAARKAGRDPNRRSRHPRSRGLL